MKIELSKHVISYGILGIMLAVFSVLFLLAWPNREWQRLLIGLLMLGYFVWGIVSHTKSNVLTVPIVMEYLGVSLLVGLLLVLVTI